MADLQGDRSYLMVFSSGGFSYELFLPGAGWPNAFTGYMNPILRIQGTGESRELQWQEAEDLAAQLQSMLTLGDIGKGGTARAGECLEALTSGKRYGVEVTPVIAADPGRLRCPVR